ncbi:helix-turn-helix domain-containing protein [Chitinophaga sp. 22321]
MMKHKKSARKYNSAPAGNLLGEISALEAMQLKTKMSLAARLDDLLKAKGLGKSEFAEIVKKNPSEITKWLSGTQNFTLDILVEIAVALGVPVTELFVEKKADRINWIHLSVNVKEVEQSIQYKTPSYIVESVHERCWHNEQEVHPSHVVFTDKLCQK